MKKEEILQIVNQIQELKQSNRSDFNQRLRMSVDISHNRKLIWTFFVVFMVLFLLQIVIMLYGVSTVEKIFANRNNRIDKIECVAGLATRASCRDYEWNIFERKPYEE